MVVQLPLWRRWLLWRFLKLLLNRVWASLGVPISFIAGQPRFIFFNDYEK
jgi:hypothetical protein